MHELISHAVDVMCFAANGDRNRLQNGFHWVGHGVRENIVTGSFLTVYPEYVPTGETIANVQFGATTHDVGKTSCVQNPGIWRLEGSKITPPEWEEMHHHVPEGVRVIKEWAHLRGYRLSAGALDYVDKHHERIDGSGFHGLAGDEISPVARLAAIIDGIVSRCENREYRYAKTPMSFIEAFADVYKGRGFWYDEQMLDKFWVLYRDNPYIYKPGYQWIFPNGHTPAEPVVQ